MRDDDFPDRVSDPQAEGLPDTADDDSTAYDDVNSARQADGPSPAALPADRPVAVDRFGTTAEEQRRGNRLDQRLAEEEPDVGPDDGRDRPGSEEDEPEPGSLDADVFALDVEYDPRSPVSLYDRPDYAGVPGQVGRLVEPDEGGPVDDEKDLVAYDAGAAGGGPTAEEQAMHEFRPPT
jgi:hypothetical protein